MRKQHSYEPGERKKGQREEGRENVMELALKSKADKI